MVGTVTGYYGWNAWYTDLSFDGAIFCQPVVALERFGRLANTWDVKSPSELHFPLTNLAQGMLSQYILNWPFIHFFGISHFTLQASNLIFLALTGVLICVLVVILTENWGLGLLSVVLFYTFPQMKILGLQGYGEVAATFYLLLGALVLYLALGNSKFYPWLGVVLFLTVHTKNYLVVLFPMLLMLLGYLWLRQRLVRPRDIAFFALSFTGLVILLPLYFLLRHGWDALVGELSSFSKLIVLSQYGGEGSASARGWKEFYEALRVMKESYGAYFLAYGPMFLGYGLTLATLAQGNWKRRLPAFDRTQTVIVFLFGISFFYVGYWYHFSAWLIWFRRLVPFLILHIPLFAIAIVYLYRRVPSANMRNLVVGVASTLFVLQGAHQLEGFLVDFSLPRRPDTALQERLEATRVVSQLPSDARIFAVNWWQAPRISLFSGRIFRNLPKQAELLDTEGYVILDPEALVIGLEEVQYEIGRFNCRVVWQNKSHRLYRIRPASFDLKSANRSASLELWSIGPSEARTDGQGFYAIGKEWAMWVRTRNATRTCVVVWGDTQLVTTFENPEILTATVPAHLFSKPGEFPISVYDPATQTRSASLSIVIKSP